ncbi:HDL012Cp [Eremothecium sinecaudum]|uniref:HDL012Cp n=1 Tax=Eremothecium sinecaudum TaxID=45286 RepID=A0A120K286_9SACH|nr:HDL012Cp [Eremothecium sinecaudum]AMD20732.1 HDL012Cp [Eremothecium sinecaudum]
MLSTTNNTTLTAAGTPSSGCGTAEQNEALQHEFLSSRTSGATHSLLGDFALDKFAGIQDAATNESLIKMEESPPLFSGGSACSSVLDLLGPSGDATPLVSLESLGGSADPSTWASLFDDDIPVILDDVEKADFAYTTAVNKDNGFLPTPVLEDADFPTKSPVSPSCSKRGNSSSAPSPGSTRTPSTSKKGSVSKSEKFDRLGVITYNRKQRAAPLTPVVPKSDDPVSLKRARNTEAARRSRARKLERMHQLEVRVEELLQQNTQLEDEVARLKALLAEGN